MVFENTYKAEVSELIQNIEKYLGDTLVNVVLYRDDDETESSDVFEDDLEPAFVRIEERVDPLEIENPSVYTNPARLIFNRHHSNLFYNIYTYPEERFFEVMYEYDMVQDVELQLNTESGNSGGLSQKQKTKVLDNSSLTMNSINDVLQQNRNESLSSIYQNLEYHMTTYHPECGYRASQTKQKEVSSISTYNRLYFLDEYSLHELDNVVQRVISSGRSVTHILHQLYSLGTITPETLEEEEDLNLRYQY